MRSFLGKVKSKLFIKENSLPPPYEENSNERSLDEQILQQNEPDSQALDLLASCTITEADRVASESAPSESETMGLLHSKPWGGRHRSKISLTWVLREQTEKNCRPQEKRLFYEDFRVKNGGCAEEDYTGIIGQWNRNKVTHSRTNRDDSSQVISSRTGDHEYQISNSRQWNRDAVSHYRISRNESEVKTSRIGQGGAFSINSSSQWSRAESRIVRNESQVTVSRKGNRDDKTKSARIVGRNELYNCVKAREVCGETSSEGTSAGGSVSERGRRRQRRRRKRDGFGYEIDNIDGFLEEASIERPCNIPVVLCRASTLHETRAGAQRETPLPLGSVVNAVFRKRAWLYVQTPHAHEGYVPYAACLPLGILPADSSESPRRRRKTPCWESSTDVYPRPCGNMTDAEKARRGARARSECGRARRVKAKSLGGEEAFDRLYLRAASLGGHDGGGDQDISSSSESDTEASQRTLVVVPSPSTARAARTSRGKAAALQARGGRADTEIARGYI